MKRLFLLLATFQFFLTAAPLFAQNAKVDKKSKSDLDFNLVDDVNDGDESVMSLWGIRRLITQRKLTEALNELQKYIEAKPDNFDNAQILIEAIMKRRLLYTDYAQRAMESSINNPEDDETPSLYIKRMEDIETNPPEEMKKVVRQLKELHLFKYYQKRFVTILQNSSDLAENLDDNNNLSESIVSLVEGFDIYLPEFREEFDAESEIVVSGEKVTEDLSKLISEISVYLSAGKLDDLNAQFKAYVQEGNYEGAAALFPQIQTEFDLFNDYLAKIYELDSQYTDLEDQLREINPEITDANYLSFMHHYITGVSDIKNSGIINIMKSKILQQIAGMKNSVENKLVETESKFREKLPSKILVDGNRISSDSVKNEFVNPVKNLGKLDSMVSGLYKKVKNISPDILSSNKKDVLSYEYLTNLSDSYSDVIVRAQNLKITLERQAAFFAEFEKESHAGGEDTNKQVDTLFTSLAEITDITGVRKDLLPESYEWGTNYFSEEWAGTRTDWNPVTEIYTAYVDEMFDSSKSVVENAWKQISILYRSDSVVYEKEMENYTKAMEILEKGFDESIAETKLADYNRKGSEAELISYLKQNENKSIDTDSSIKYPGLVTKLADYIDESSARFVSNLEAEKNTLHSNVEKNEDWQNNPQINEIVNTADQYISEKIKNIYAYRDSAMNKKSKAEKNIQLAKEAKQQADRLFADAVAACDRELFEESEEYLDRARTKYYESLSYSEDNSLREESYKKRTELENKILVGKNNIVVRETRNLLDTAKTAYNLEEYDRALSIISNAEEKWAVTNPDNPNQELSDFKALIEIANSITTGRTLDPNDPVYSIVSQNLSFANQYYETAEKQKKNGETENYKLSLAQSEDYIGQVKLVYPKNKAASILQLKIDRLRDPDSFRKEFDLKIQAAVNKVDNGNQEAKEEGLNDLYAYQQLEPNYKNLNTIVLNAEYATGKKRRPVTNREQTQAVRYIQDAEKYYNTARNDADYQKAIDAADMAIALLDKDSSYISRAQRVKDNSLLKKTPPVPMLTASDEGLFEQIQSAFSAQNYDKARNLMNSLLKKNSSYIKIDRVKKLSDNIERQLSS